MADQNFRDSALRARQRGRLLSALAVAVIAATVLWGAWYWVARSGRVSTDNAYVGADAAQVTPLISAAVKAVTVINTQAVRKGDVLVVLDDADQRIAISMAEAALAQAEDRYGQARGNAGAARGRLMARISDIAQARARLAEAEATLARAKADLVRREALAANGFVSGEQLTTSRTTFQAAQASRDAALAGLRSAEGNRQAASGDVQSNEALVSAPSAASAPDVAAARARLEQARLDLERTIIRAPIDGVVTNRQVQVGQRVAAGLPLMKLVPLNAIYVDANFKETQLTGVRPGQPATLTSEFYGDEVVYHGRVVGFAGGTGAAFSLIPAQNATGNWIKVVQRLPVRIALNPTELKAHPLRVGLSMEATIDKRGR